MSQSYFVCPRCGSVLDFDPQPSNFYTPHHPECVSISHDPVAECTCGVSVRDLKGVMPSDREDSLRAASAPATAGVTHPATNTLLNAHDFTHSENDWENFLSVAAKLNEAEALLRRIRGWDVMDATADGPYWRGEIDDLLSGNGQ
jgi:hypothetical protein